MKQDLTRLSGQFLVRKIEDGDVDQVLRLCQSNPMFYQYCPPHPSRESILEDMVKLPPRTAPEDKYYLGFFENGQLLAVMDLIFGYPCENAAFIGFFMVDASLQGSGLGSRIVTDACRFLQQQGCAFVRLGWIQGNPQSQHFWQKNGFRETGVTSSQEDYTIICAQRNLTHS